MRHVNSSFPIWKGGKMPPLQAPLDYGPKDPRFLSIISFVQVLKRPELPATKKAKLSQMGNLAIYKTVNRMALEFKEKWSQYPGAVSVWERNFHHVLQLFNHGSAVRKIIYTTNAIESVNSSLRKVTKKGSFPNEDSVYKALYLRIVELEKKWQGRTVQNWAMVRNQLLCEEELGARLEKYSAR